MIPDSVVEAALDAARRHRIPDTDSLVVFKELYPSSYAIAMSDMRRALEAAAPLMAQNHIPRMRHLEALLRDWDEELGHSIYADGLRRRTRAMLSPQPPKESP